MTRRGFVSVFIAFLCPSSSVWIEAVVYEDGMAFFGRSCTVAVASLNLSDICGQK
jgi:hypothetical protein